MQTTRTSLAAVLLLCSVHCHLNHAFVPPTGGAPPPPLHTPSSSSSFFAPTATDSGAGIASPLFPATTLPLTRLSAAKKKKSSSSSLSSSSAAGTLEENETPLTATATAIVIPPPSPPPPSIDTTPTSSTPTTPSSSSSPPASPTTKKTKKNKHKHMKPPPAHATKADFGLSSPNFELELMPHGNDGVASSSSSSSSSTRQTEDDHTTEANLRRIRSLGKFPVLVLNTDAQPLSYLPLSIVRWQDAVKAIFLERVHVLEYYDHFIQSTAGPWQLPSVISLKQYQKSYRERAPPLNRRNLYIRDSFTCAYCLTRLKNSDLTLDHVQPRVKGGKGTWENLVTCCRTCNRKKGKRTVKELRDIGMQLQRPPRKPKMAELQAQARKFRTAAGTFPHESWETYM